MDMNSTEYAAIMDRMEGRILHYRNNAARCKMGRKQYTAMQMEDAKARAMQEARLIVWMFCDDECEKTGDRFACDFVRHKREDTCEICPLKSHGNDYDMKALADRIDEHIAESESKRIADKILIIDCPKCQGVGLLALASESQREAAESADEKPDCQAENANVMASADTQTPPKETTL